MDPGKRDLIYFPRGKAVLFPPKYKKNGSDAVNGASLLADDYIFRSDQIISASRASLQGGRVVTASGESPMLSIRISTGFFISVKKKLTRRSLV